jgi:hypothetical protein
MDSAVQDQSGAAAEVFLTTFGELLAVRCGAFVWPLLACSFLVWAVGVGSLLGAGTTARLDRLALLATSIGLLGTVAGMIGAFAQGASGGAMAQSIAVAYWTTGFGMTSACTAHVFRLIDSARRGEAA